MRPGNYQLNVKESNVLKILIKTQYGPYQFLVILFGLMNTPAAFMDMMNRDFEPYLDQFVITFNDDILIYSKTESEHDKHLSVLLQIL